MNDYMWNLRPLSFMVLAAASAALLGAQACSPEAADDCSAEPVDAFKELVIVDEDVLDDPRSKNETSGVWSFRHAIENMTPAWIEPGDFIYRWLNTWIADKTFRSFSIHNPVEPRDGMMKSRVLCPWYKRTAGNECNEDCTTCVHFGLDLAKSPFRLIAITNRVDLRDEVVNHPRGEARLVFALTDGAADDPASLPLAFAAIFEYRVPESLSTREWAEGWHGLAKFPHQDEPYRAALENLTNAVTKRGANPAAVNGSALGQLRTNESFLNWIWQLREFDLDVDGLLVLRPTRNTPAEVLNSSPDLVRWVNANADAIKANRYEMPEAMASAATDAFRYRWELPGVEPELSRTFAQNTCNGCHSEGASPTDTAFHITPFRKGSEKLSAFVHNPSAPTDDLRRRTASYRRALCGQ